MEPQIAVRGDGAFIVGAMTNSGLPPLTIVGGPGGINQIFIPWSTSTNPFGTQFNDFSPMGPPRVNSDGNAYLEYEVRQIAYPPKITSAVLYLLKIALDNSATTMTLSSTTEDVNLLQGRIIPDGNGEYLRRGRFRHRTRRSGHHPILRFLIKRRMWWMAYQAHHTTCHLLRQRLPQETIRSWC